MSRLVIWSLLFIAAAVLAKDSDILLRIRETQNLLLLQGPSVVVLGEYDRLISDLENAEEKIASNVAAQVYYKKALVELSLNKIQPAVTDLIRTLDLDPTLTPASAKLLEVLMEGGKFAEIRSHFSADKHADLFYKMETWENAYLRVSKFIAGESSDLTTDECLDTINLYLMPLTPANPAVYDANLFCSKKKISELLSAGEDGAVPSFFKDVISDYSTLLKLQPQRNLQLYSDFAQYVLFTQNMVNESWNIVKACLRIDNDFQQCGALSKTFSRLQDILKQLESYSILDGYLYPNSEEQTDLPQEKLDSFEFDFRHIHQVLYSPINLPKREMNKLPLYVKSTYDFLLWKAGDFANQEFGLESKKSSLKFVTDLNRLACEAGVRNGDVKNKYCSAVEDEKNPFFPKHSARIDSLLNKKKYDEAQKELQRFNKNVQKTAFYKERVSIIEQYRHQQQQKQQQYEFNQRQQRQRQYQRQRQEQHQQYQQQQRQQPQRDTTKDYYKILDVPRDADEKTIKKGYRAQTLKYHPDKYKGGDLSEKQIETKMQEINEAYEVLSDAKSRESYDRESSQQHGGFGGHQGGFGGHQGGPNMNYHFNPDFMANFMREGNFQFQFR